MQVGTQMMIRGDWSSDSSWPGPPGQDELPAHAADETARSISLSPLRRDITALLQRAGADAGRVVGPVPA